MEYLKDCSTTIRCVARKVGLYVLEMISLWGCNFWTGGLAYDTFLKFNLETFSFHEGIT